jgi:hypothetical protein
MKISRMCVLTSQGIKAVHATQLKLFHLNSYKSTVAGKLCIMLYNWSCKTLHVGEVDQLLIYF